MISGPEQKSILIVGHSLPYDTENRFYTFINKLKTQGVDIAVYLGRGLLEKDIVEYYTKILGSAVIENNLENCLINNDYSAICLLGLDSAPFYFNKVKSLTDKPIILLDNSGADKFKFDFTSFSPEEILKAIGLYKKESTKLSSIIILTFNQLNITKMCIDSLEKHTKEPYELIFVDNGSKDGTVKFLKEYGNKNKVNCIFNDSNMGFSYANNQGIKISRGEYIVLLNNDVILTEKWLYKLILCAETYPRAGTVGPITNAAAGPQKVTPAYEDLRDLDKYSAAFSLKNAGQWVDSYRLNAFCMLIKKEIISRVGLLDEKFGPGGYEDYDYCLRVRQAGYKNVLAGDTYVHHVGGQGYKPNNLDYNALRSLNKQIFINKWCRKILEIMEVLPNG